MNAQTRLSLFDRLPALPRAYAALLLLLCLLAGSGLAHAQEAADPAPPPARTVNINTADANQLADGLNGVGKARAEAIVRYRELYGPFQSVDELAEVSGIGQSTIERNRAAIVVE